MVGPRELGRLRGDAPGPTLVVIAGLHGNEAAGVEAARRVIGRTAAIANGDVVALAGNVRALAARRRFLARDLNRLWTADRLATARAAASDDFSRPTLDGAELSELAELATDLDGILAAARGPVFAVDLHTTSAAGVPFAVVGATRAHHDFAAALPIPGIVGIEETLPGTLTRYLSGRGCTTLAIEGGQSDTPAALAQLEAALVVLLDHLGLARLAERDEAHALLLASRGRLPARIEVVSRYEVRPEHEFRMAPGFANIQATAEGTLLAHDRDGEIRAPFDGVVLLPLYQAQGSDGFFYGKPA